MNFSVGDINKLKVLRETDIGFILINEFLEEVFIHYNQVKGDIKEGDLIDVFILFDSNYRLTATMEKPYITILKPGFVVVEDVLSKSGVFVDNNLFKDIIIFKDDLPYDKNKWPKKGDLLFCKLKKTSKQLFAKIVNPFEINDFLIPTSNLNRNMKVDAYVVKSGDYGINLITKEGHKIFVFYKHKRRDYRIGEKVLVTITNVKNKFSYNGSLLKNKVEMIDLDSDLILNYLKNNGGKISFTTKSDPFDIENEFNMSKAAFKRAIGKLYKEKVINFDDNYTFLV